MIRNYFVTTLRNLLRNKGFSLINIFGLATGMAVFILIYLWVSFELNYDVSVPRSSQIYRVNFEYEREGKLREHWRTPPALAKALRESYPEIEGVTRFYEDEKLLLSRGPEHRFYLTPGFTDTSFFRIFEPNMIAGDHDRVLENPWSIVLTKTTANTFFGQEDPIGQPLSIDNRFHFSVTGVIEDPPANSILKYDFLIPFHHMEEMHGFGQDDTWNDWGYNTFILASENHDKQDLSSKISSFEYPEDQLFARDLVIQPLQELHLYGINGNGSIDSIYIFSSIAIFVLLVACINYMNLTTARSMKRAREIAIRKSGGASQKEIILQFLGESVLVSLISLIIALILVWILMPWFNNLSGEELKLNLLHGPLLLFLLGIMIITGLVSGSYPALVLSAVKPVEIFQKSMHRKHGWLRKVLVVFQFALSVFLLVCTIVFSRQLNHINNQQLGFETDQVVFIPATEELMPRFEAFRNQLMEHAGISGVTATSNKIGTKPFWGTVLDNWQGREDEDHFSLNIIYADPYFASTFDLPMAEGRFYEPGRPGDYGSLVINEAAARRMGMDEAAGKAMFTDSNRIIGVMKDFNFRSLHEDIKPMVILMDPQFYTEIGIKLSSRQIPEALAFIEETYQKFSPNYPFQYAFLNDDIARMYDKEQRMQNLFLTFSGLAILISCLGLLGLSVFSAEQRRREIGIRKVMGATVWNVCLKLSREYAWLILIANLIAWPVAWYFMSKWLEGFAYKSTLAWWIFLLSGILAFMVAMLTMTSQTIKAARINPSETLQYE